jgi:LacI family transcriptional regulator
MAKHPRPATLQDVADRCGVSLATASKAFNPRSEDIGAATRERLLAAARELGFQRDRSTSLRARKRWQNIGMAWGRHAPRGDGIYAELGETLALTIKPWGYHLLFTPIADAADWRLMQRAQRLDGVIVVESMADEVLAELVATGYPAVLLNLATKRELPRLLPDDHAGCSQLVDHLADLGHRSLAFIPSGVWVIHASDAVRWAGVSERAAARGMTAIRCQAAEAVAAAKAGTITAAIAYSQREAVMLLPLARAAGLSIPRDLSIVVGSDVPWLEHTDPPLTGLEIPIPAMARQAVTLLVDLIELTAAPETGTRLIPEVLHLRASTAPPRR